MPRSESQRRTRAPRSGRRAEVVRRTKETNIRVTVNIDGTGQTEIDTGVPFLDHMIESFGRHGLFDLRVTARGDIEVDSHHTVEDVGLTLGQALREALGDKVGIRRFGAASCPLDEALVTVAVDLGGRPFLAYHLTIKRARVGSFDTELVHDFLLAVTNQLGMNLHVNMTQGRNAHHIIEACFKALARAMDEATRIDPRVTGVLSTKGAL